MAAVVTPFSSSAALPASTVGLRKRLEDPMFRRWLSAIVSRRIPHGETDDVVQSVLCDALASPGIPSDDREISKWIFGIARNKVADFHRRARRENAPSEEMGIGERSGEVRVLLRSVVADASAAPRSREALDWIVREHAGEELSAIAEEVELPAPVVRQRVSRLRRALRERWLGASGILVLLFVAGAGLSEWKSRFAHENIVADTAGSPAANAFLTDIDGEWRIAETAHFKGDWSPDILSAARVRIAGARLIVEFAGVAHQETIAIDDVRSNAIDARLLGESQQRHVTATLRDDALFVTDGERSVRLVRP